MNATAEPTQEIRRVFDARHPAVLEFLRAQSRYVLGWGRGGEGKTAVGLHGIPWHAQRVYALSGGYDWWPIRTVIVRESRKVIGKTIGEEIKYWFPEEFGLSKWHGREDEPERIELFTKLYLPDGSVVGGGKPYKFADVHCIGVDSQSDLNKLAGMQIGLAWVDEPVSQLAEGGGVSAETIGVLVMRSRQFPWRRIQLTFNPPNRENYVNQIWIEKEIPKRLPDAQRAAIAKIRAESTVVYFPAGMNKRLDQMAPGYAEQNADFLNAIGRPDMASRFVGGQVGPALQGEPVTPEFGTRHQRPVTYEPGRELIMGWDFGVHSSCAIAQLSRSGQLNFIAAFSAPNTGTKQMIEQYVHPYLMELGVFVPPREQLERVITQDARAAYRAWDEGENARERAYGVRNETPYRRPELVQSGWAEIGVTWRHVIDPAGDTRDQSNSEERATLVIQRMLGGSILPADQSWPNRRAACHEGLSRPFGSEGMWVQVNPERAECLVSAFSGGWYYRKLPNGDIQKDLPEQNSEYAHIGNAAAYLLERVLRIRESRANEEAARRQKALMRGVLPSMLAGSRTNV